MMDENWETLTGFFPENWRELALDTGALKGLRKNKSEEDLLRTLLIHLGLGYSLRETALRARQAGLAELSDVALLKRLRKSKNWLHAMCLALLAQRHLDDPPNSVPVRMVDATIIKEPGKTGSFWRLHYGLRMPSLTCDFFRLSATKGKGSGESLKHVPIEAGDLILADRGYSSVSGIRHAHDCGAFVTVRFNTRSTPAFDPSGKSFPLLDAVGDIQEPGVVSSWDVRLGESEDRFVFGRICALRKSEVAARASEKKLKRRASKTGHKLRPETLEFAKYVIVFSTFPTDRFSDVDVLEWYRLRWQVELVFKRFKQIAELGHLPKHDEESAKAWLYGKLFIALVTESLIEYAESISPWGYRIDRQALSGKPLA